MSHLEVDVDLILCPVDCILVIGAFLETITFLGIDS